MKRDDLLALVMLIVYPTKRVVIYTAQTPRGDRNGAIARRPAPPRDHARSG